MRPLKVGEIAAAVRGEILCGSPDALVTHVSIDSRDVPENTLFVPIVGEHTDAHRFLPDVAAKGAAAAFTAEGYPGEAMPETMALIRVPDTLASLQDLAAAYRRKIRIPLIGITGSVGKTTTRELTALALSSRYRVYKTPANHNSQIGVPLTVLEIGEEEIGVIEMGMSIPGEMTKISRIVRPDAAVFTNIGLAHIEQLGSRENIRAEKMHIQDGMPENSVMILNGDDPLLSQYGGIRPGFRSVFYGTGKNADCRAENVTMEDGLASFTAVIGRERVRVHLNVFGAHEVLNAMAALTAADEFGADLQRAAERVSSFRGYRHRQQVFQHDGITVVDDSYNASPSSMAAALRILGGMRKEKRRIAVLADMLELGESAGAMHREAGKNLVRNHSADVLFTLGDLGKEIAEGARRENPDFEIYSFDDREALRDSLFSFVQAGDAVLFKGSNGMKLSALADQMSGNA